MAKDSSASDIFEKAFDITFVGVALFAVWDVVYAWVVMVGLGILHSQWPQIPAFGYGTTYVLMLALWIVARLFR